MPCFPLIAQTPFVVEYLGVADGLPTGSIHGVAQDARGIIWLSTLGSGLIRYDGSTFKVFNQLPESKPRLSSNHTRDVITDHLGRLWIAHHSGIDILQPESMEITHRIPLFGRDTALNGQACSLYLAPDGDIWVAVYNKGVFRFPNADPGQAILVDSIGEALYINGTPSGKIYCISTLKGMYVLENGHFRPTFPILEHGETGEEQIKPIEDQNGFLAGFWLLFPEIRADPYHFDEKTGGFEPGHPESGISVLSMPEFGKKNLEFASPLSKMPLFHHPFRIFKDNQGLIWVSMEYGGLFKLKSREMAFQSCPELEGTSLRGMLEASDGSVYIATYNGLFRYLPKLNKAIWLSKKNQDIFFHLAQIRRDTLTVLSESQGLGNYMLRPPWRVTKVNLKDITVDYCFFSSLSLPDHWIMAGNQQVFRFSQQDLRAEPLFTLPGTQSSVRTFSYKMVRNGDIWIGTTEGVFVRTKAGVCIAPELRKDHRLGAQSRINDIFEDEKGRLWFATHNYGLLCYDPVGRKIISFDQHSGFASNEVYKIAASHDGKVIWASTFSGLQCIELPAYKIHFFTEADGTSGSEFNTGSALQTTDGTLYFGGVRGLTRFNPEHFNPAQHPPPTPYISELYIEDVYSNVISMLNLPKRDTLLRLSNSQNTLEFHLGSNDYFRPRNNTFFVQLKNIDVDWVPLGALTSIKYYRLAPGAYTLRVKFNINGDKLSSQVFELSFIIDQVFYKKWWFLSLAALFILGSIGAVLLLRRRRIKREENIRRAIAHDLHNTLGGKISSISNMIYLIDRLHKSSQPFQKELQLMLDLTRKAQSTMSDVIWVFTQTKSKSAGLINRMEDYADKWLRAAQIKVDFEHNLSGFPQAIPFSIQHELLMVYKEMLGNVLKHTFSEKVLIRFMFNPDQSLMLSVENEFSQRKPDVVSGGEGLLIIKEHLERIGGILHTSASENHFKVEIRFAEPLRHWRQR